MTKTCEICQTRPAQTKAAALRDFGTDFPYCLPCHKFAEDENSHSDHGHQDGVDANGQAQDDCWVCHPELDQTATTYRQRTGTSRQGMVITVPIRGTAKAKADAVIAQLDPSYAISKPRTVKGITTLKFASATQEFVIRWDAQGRFIAASTVENNKAVKLRNVAAVLRAATA